MQRILLMTIRLRLQRVLLVLTLLVPRHAGDASEKHFEPLDLLAGLLLPKYRPYSPS